MSNPLVTVLMTVYNPGPYLRIAVESLLQQTHKDFEILIIDDGSTDGAITDISNIVDERIRIHKNIQNLGQTRSLNVGLRLARGAWIARLDADDFAYNDWLLTQLTYVHAHPNCTVVSTKAVVMDQNNKIYKPLNSPLNGTTIILKSLFFSPLNHVGSLINRAVILEEGGYDEDFHIAADYALWAKLIQSGYELACVANIGVAIRVHQQSVTAQAGGRKDKPEIVKVIQQHVSTLTTTTINEESAEKIYQFVYQPETLDVDGFCQQYHYIQTLYANLKEDYHVSSGEVFLYSRHFFQNIYMRKIFSLFNQADGKGVRICAASFMRQYGRWNIFAGIWLTTFLGIGRILPIMYQELNRHRSWWKKSSIAIK